MRSTRRFTSWQVADESPVAKTGLDLMLMAMSRCEIQGSPDCRDWYIEQRHEWSQHLRILLGQIEEIDPSENGDT